MKVPAEQGRRAVDCWAAANARSGRRRCALVKQKLGVLVDALGELGRYDEAADAVQTMLDRNRKPNIESCARAAYVRELRGDLSGAVEAMRLAVAAGGEVPENEAYVATLLGDLEFTRGRLASAVNAYRDALRRFPGFSPGEAGLARVDAARGQVGPAIDRLRRLVARLPAAPALVELGELELAAGPDVARPPPPHARRRGEPAGARSRRGARRHFIVQGDRPRRPPARVAPGAARLGRRTERAQTPTRWAGP